MKSHSCDFKPSALLPLLGFTLLPVALFAIAMRTGAAWGLLPDPRPTLDAERTVIVHQAEAARTPQRAEVILIGDSSCMMNLSARQLGESLQTEVLNLATFSYLDLHAHATLLREFTLANPGRPRTVVLLLHPETLRRSGADAYYAGVSSSFIAGREPVPGEAFDSHARYWLGVDVFRERLLSRTLPVPLRGAFARRYGFTKDLDATLARDLGCLIDPDEPQPLSGRPEYRLAPTLEKASRAFRKTLSPEVELLVGITPVPEKLAERNYLQWRNASLGQWSQWLAPATALTNLPSTLPDDRFTRSTHLRENAIPSYTEAVAQALKSLLRP
jgi:hypothetical protein